MIESEQYSKKHIIDSVEPKKVEVVYQGPINSQKTVTQYQAPKRKQKKNVIDIILVSLIILLAIIYCNEGNQNSGTNPNPAITENIQTEANKLVEWPDEATSIMATYHKYADEPNTLIINNKTDVACHIDLMDDTNTTVLSFDAPVGASQIKMPVGNWKVILQFEGEEAVPCDDEIFSAWDATDPVTLILDYK